MFFYIGISADNYETLICCNAADYPKISSLGLEATETDWTPIRVRRIIEDAYQRPLKRSHFPSIASSVLTMTEEAVLALSQVLDSSGDVLPLTTVDNIPLYVFRPQVIDALDREKSSIIEYQHPKGHTDIFDISNVCFKEAMLDGVSVFRLPIIGGSIYYSQDFIDQVNAADLKGLDFRIV